MKTIFGSALVTLPPSTAEYIRFDGETLAEWNGAADWSDYIYSGGQRIARADNYEDRLVVQGTRCDSNNSGCGWQYTLAALQNGSNYILHGYVIQAGDKLLVRQYQPTGVEGGEGIYFIDGYATWDYGLYDQDGQSSIQDAVVNTWHSRRFDLTQFAGKTINMVVAITEGGTLPGPWSLYYQDFVLLSADGTVHKIYSRDKSVSAYIWGTTGMTGTSATVNHSGGEGSHQVVTTTYYHGDHLGSSRLLSSADGYSTWQGTYYPYGMEYTPPGSTDNTATVNNYKFTGKERDAESGLDYFGARYFGSSMGRFMSPDPLLTTLRPENPQTLNRYAYTLNNPLRYVDPTGAYEEDVHQQLTTVLAQAAGFDEKNAGEIGRADQGVDEDSKTGPFASEAARRDYHFTTEERRNDLWSAFDASGSTEDLGTYLHAEQDSFSHEGYGPRFGHLSARHAPDKTYNDPAKADRMAKDTYGKLTAAADRLGIKSSNRVAFAKIDKLVSAFNKAKTTEDKNKILNQIKGVIKDAQQEQNKKKPEKQK